MTHTKLHARDDTSALRARMERQLRIRGITDARVLAAMRAVPRELFVPEGSKARAYDDTALPIAAGQTISQPYVVAKMLEIAGIREADRVLEVGAGSGYGAAVMAQLARDITAIERHPSLVALARSNLARAGIRNATILAGDGTQGLLARAPFDVIVVSAGGAVPEALTEQLAIGGRLVMPRGDSEGQRLVCLTRAASGSLIEDDYGAVSFVPLVAAPARAP